MSDLFTFERFEPGKALGSVPIVLDAAFRDLWDRVYPNDPVSGDLLPVAASTVILMKAWRTVVAPRPPGNIHASQTVDFIVAPRLGEIVNARVECVAKHETKGRRFVTLHIEASGEGGRALFSGRSLLIWAA